MGIRTVKTLSTLIFSAVCTFMNPLFAGDLPSFENNGHHLSCYDLKTSSNNKKYLDFTFADKTGEINGKLWDVKPEMESLLKVGLIVKIKGTITLWQTFLQLKIVRIRLLNDEDQVEVSEIVPSAPIEPEMMYADICKYIENMQDEDIKGITRIIVEE